MWEELAIAATQDAAVIRRAYAARLKIVRPDEDPAGFARLRSAYEAALASATVVRPATIQTSHASPAEPAATPNPPVTAPAPAPQVNGDHRAVIAALQKGDVSLAADALEAALRRGTLPIGAEMQLSAYMIDLLVRKVDIPPRLLTDTAKRFGWLDGDTAPSDTAVRHLQARIEAEQWYASLRQTARSPVRFIGAPRAGAALLLLGRGRFTLSRLLPPQPPLQALLSELQVHGSWLPGRFDPVRIALVEKLIGGMIAKARRRASYLDPRGWSAFFTERYLRYHLLAVLPGVAGGMALHSFVGGVFSFNFARFLLARRPQWLRQAALFGTLAAALVIAAQFQTYAADPAADLAAEPAAITFEAPPVAPSAWPVAPYHLATHLLDLARRGDTESMLAIGKDVYQQARLPPQASRGAEWVAAAANRGNVAAMLYLDTIFLDEYGLLYDSAQAFKWSGIALRQSVNNSDTALARADHKRAAAGLGLRLPGPLIKQIRDWRPHNSPLPN